MQHLDLRAGDILACYGSDLLSRYISLRTSSLRGTPKWSPSHVAIVVDLAVQKAEKQPLLVESTTLCRTPCLMAGQCVSGVQVHHPWDRIDEYTSRGGWVDVYRHHPAYEIDSEKLTDLVERFLLSRAIPYDPVTAALSAPLWAWHLRFAPDEDLESLFCSEAIAFIEKQFGHLTGNAGTYNPGRLVRRLTFDGVVKFHHRFHGGVPHPIGARA